ncbi:DUF2254 domain-containing protein [Porifericola rhodea]|uniref:DUF2254 domain-containing protein n=1 Tax=Porifericola rhodea TaxID=930972 RepID=UPI002665A850|nr:DUF2254 domain-containing protein [Porifericola rhodea]WKN32734.1 DUF2254 domain-containing protein [Porifericola rhodea]
MLKKAAITSTNTIVKLYLNIISSIAFYPTFISVGLFLLSLLTLYTDQRTPDELLGRAIDIKNVLAPDSVRTLLGTIAGGMISLMVFSFSMVMVVLNQTSSSYSPRLLPTLVKKKHHQIVMGFYIGTIAYSFMVLSSIESLMYTFQVPSLSVIVNVLLSIICLALFISFINRISQDIQIGNIINELYQATVKGIEYEIEHEVYVPDSELPDMAQWSAVKSLISGYLDTIDDKRLIRTAKNMDVVLKICIPIGQFVNRKDVLLLSSRQLSETEQQKLFETMIFRHQENISENYLYGFKQLSEVAIKALSPGINDPGTALQALDRLTDLFVLRTSVYGLKIKVDDANGLRLIYQPAHFSLLIYYCMSTIMNYADKAVPVYSKLIQMFSALLQNDEYERYTDNIMALVNDLLIHINNKLTTLHDRQVLNEQIRKLVVAYPEHQLAQAMVLTIRQSSSSEK